MRLALLKALLPWIIFFAFADGSLFGLMTASISGLVALLLFNFAPLRKRFFLAWATLIFFLLMFVGGVLFGLPGFYKNGLLFANVALAIVFMSSLLTESSVSLQYVKPHVNQAFWKNPLFCFVNTWITVIWGVVFLSSAITIGLFSHGIGTKLMMVEILPTAFIVVGIAFMILFPDVYKSKVLKRGGVSSMHGLSEIKHVRVGDVDIAYRTLGKGPLLIMAHGYRMNMHGWDPDLLRKLSESFEVLIFDYPGTGLSLGSLDPFNVDTASESLSNMIERLNKKPVAIVGYSMGSWVAQTFAAKYPKKLVGIVLIGTEPDSDAAVHAEPEVLALMKCSPEEIVGEKGKKMLSILIPEEVLPRVSKKMQDIFTSANFEGEFTESILKKEEELIADWFQKNRDTKKKLNLPVLLIVGSKDVITPPENSRIMHKELKQSKLIEYDDAGHGIIYQYPADIADNIREFLHRHPAAK